MECAPAVQTQDASSLAEETGDSEDGVEAMSISYDDDDDGRESCNGFVCSNGESDEDGDGNVDSYQEEKITWEMWLVERSRWKKIEAESLMLCSNIDEEDDEEENRLFWETCLASGY